MKRVLLAVLLAAVATAAAAGEAEKRPRCAGFVTGRFWDNWEVSGAAGIGTSLSNGPDLGPFGNRIGFEANASLTKWLHPVAGVRVQLQGGRFATYGSAEDRTMWPYLFAHIDWMVNLSNWIGGYRPDRVYYAAPFIGLGYMAANFTDASKRRTGVGATQQFAFAYGLLNKFRVSRSVDLNIELKGLFASSRISPVPMGGSYLFGFSATAGITYRFNKRGWKRAVPYSVEDVRAFQRAVEESHAALEAARECEEALARERDEALAAAEAAEAARAAAETAARAAAEAAAASAAAPAETVILYDYGMSVLSPKERTRLELVADAIRQGPCDRVYRIEGHADKGTGTRTGNARVARNRARIVYDFLVGRGVDPSQLTYEGMGDRANPFERGGRANRAVIIR